MSKSNYVFANNFFFAEFFQNFFNGFENQREILRFLIPKLNFWKKNFFALISMIANAQETAQKTEKNFL